MRDRQRADTLHALHTAAIAQAREDGVASATVDAIAERAGVSRRTFFNYYPSKEDAILGAMSPVMPEEALDRFFARVGDDRFTEALRLVIAIVQSTRQVEIKPGVLSSLIVEFPELRDRLIQHVTAAEGLIAAALEQHSGGRVSSIGQDPAALRALVMLAATVLRFAYTDDPDGVCGPSDEAIDSAIAVFRNVLAEIL